jgi:hypothetical protein
MDKMTGETPTSPKVDTTRFWITKAVYSKSKGTVAVTVLNWTGTDVHLERMAIVYGQFPKFDTIAAFERFLENTPAEKVDYTMKDKESKTWTVKAKELPIEVWAVPSSHSDAATILRVDIKLEA